MTIVTKLSGGLGNQLFQYAAARHLGLQLGRPVVADLHWFRNIPDGSTPRTPLLAHFHLPLDYADSRGNPRSLAGPAHNPWHALTRPVRILQDRRHFHFDERLAAQARRSRLAYLDGYWQSYRYFASSRSRLLDDLRPRSEAHPAYADVSRRIQHTESVMVHVRRGDYVHSSSAASVHGTLGLDYYRDALELIGRRVAGAELFFFSDDIDWVRRNVPCDLPATYVASAPGEAAVIDELDLMRRCRHHVIANSSLSWWGAWLSDAPNKTVIAPGRWLNARPLDTRDLLPADWTVLEVAASTRVA